MPSRSEIGRGGCLGGGDRGAGGRERTLLISLVVQSAPSAAIEQATFSLSGARIPGMTGGAGSAGASGVGVGGGGPPQPRRTTPEPQVQPIAEQPNGAPASEGGERDPIGGPCTTVQARPPSAVSHVVATPSFTA